MNPQWPALPLEEWKPTLDTLHMWTQMAGKVRLAMSPHSNHWWEVAMYVDARGLTTSVIPYDRGVFELRFDFLDHNLVIETSRNETAEIPLRPVAVADFYREFMRELAALGIHPRINPMPMEVPDPIPFDQDRVHAFYDPEPAQRFWQILVSVDTVLKEFRARFLGKSSPVHFFWGSFDLAVTRFSGRRAPERPGADRVTREAYSHEVISAGFWPGGGLIAEPAFYCYEAPQPAGFDQAAVAPEQAYYHRELGEFLLRYEDVRKSASPRDTLMQFLESTYAAGANLAGWDRAALEREVPGGAAF